MNNFSWNKKKGLTCRFHSFFRSSPTVSFSSTPGPIVAPPVPKTHLVIVVIHIWISVWIIQATEKYSAAIYICFPTIEREKGLHRLEGDILISVYTKRIMHASKTQKEPCHKPLSSRSRSLRAHQENVMNFFAV